MPRNGSGTYTLPQAAFVPGTTIASAAMNSNLSDIATALTQSIASTGVTPITGALAALSGSSAGPSYSFSTDPASGLYLRATSKPAIVGNALGVTFNGLASAASAAPTVAAGGTGYINGDTIIVTGGAFINPVVLTVTNAAVGVIQPGGVSLLDAGRYTTAPTAVGSLTQGSTSGGGLSATFTPAAWNTVLALTDLSDGQLWQALGGTNFFKNTVVSATSAATIIGSGGVTGFNLAGSAISPNVTMVNGTLVQSQAGGAQTFAIKTLAGNDPSAGSPVYFVFRNVTGGTGDYAVASVTAALNITIPAGGGTNTMGFTSSTPARIWVGAILDGGAVSLFVLNALNGLNITALQGWGITNGAGGAFGGNTSGVSSATAAGIMYSASGHSSKPYCVIGYASWEAPATMVAGAWNVAPTRLELFRPGTTPLPGMRVQFIKNQTGAYATAMTPFTPGAGIPQKTDGNEYMTQTFTPASSANLLDISVQAVYSTNGSGQAGMALFQDMTANALSAVANDNRTSTANVTTTLNHTMLAATLGATVFRVRIGDASSNATYFNGAAGAQQFGGVSNSYIKIEEIMA